MLLATLMNRLQYHVSIEEAVVVPEEMQHKTLLRLWSYNTYNGRIDKGGLWTAVIWTSYVVLLAMVLCSAKGCLPNQQKQLCPLGTRVVQLCVRGRKQQLSCHLVLVRTRHKGNTTACIHASKKPSSFSFGITPTRRECPGRCAVHTMAMPLL